MSASEIAITSLSRVRVKKLIAQKPKLADSLSTWLKSPFYLLSLILTINVIADMFMSFLSAYVARQAFFMIDRHIVEFATWLLTTFVILTAGEISPKIYARKHAQKVTVFAVGKLSKIEKLFKPFIYPIIKLVEIISPKTSGSLSGELSKEEAKNIIDEGGTTGAFDNETQKMLQRTLSFGEISVKKIMHPLEQMEAVDIDLDDESFLDLVIHTSKSRVPVYKNAPNNVIGYVHIKEVLGALEKNEPQIIKQLIKEPYFIDGAKKINELLNKMQSGETHIAFIKEGDGTIGFVTLENILEELVGEIVDEYELGKNPAGAKK
jgi:CBS domain containing-hemolysin-like protein